MTTDPDNDDIETPDVGPADETKNRRLRKESKTAPRTAAQSRVALRRKVRMFYDLQRLRIQASGRGLKKGKENEIQLLELDVEILNSRASDLARAERNALADVQAHLSSMPAYTQILADKARFKGIGPTLAGVILSEVDITRANTVSALWRYAGLAPITARRCKTCNDTVVEKDGIYLHDYNRKTKCVNWPGMSEEETYLSGRAERRQAGEKLHYNSFFKTKMVGVMSGCLLKANSPYRKFYDDYKHRLQSAGKGRDDGHRHQMALRYMVKMVLLDIWVAWRTLEGLEVRPSYQEEYLGHTHHS